MMAREDGKTGLVRAVVVIGNADSSVLTMDYEDCEKRGNIKAVGFWHRHDEVNLEKEIDKEQKAIVKAYSMMDKYSGCLIGTEWKDYK